MRDNILQVEKTPDGFVKVGDRVFKKYMYLKEYKQIANILDLDMWSMCGSKFGPNSVSNPKVYNQVLSEYLGLPPTKWLKVFNAVMYDVHIKGVESYDDLFRVWKGVVSRDCLDNVKNIKTILDEATFDGLKNITPILTVFKKNPEEVKNLVGKGLWKKLCKNTYSRNLFIYKKIKASERKTMFLFASSDKTEYPNLAKTVEWLNKIPTTVLRTWAFTQAYLEPLHWASNNTPSPLKDTEMLAYCVNLFQDTYKMSKTEEEPFNPNWSYVRMGKEHKRLEKLSLTRKFSPEPVGFEPIEISYGDFTATLLLSPLEVAEEGRAMHHCVASYASDVSRKRYAVFSITRDGERYSTLGLRQAFRREWKLGQHYKASNYKVDDDYAKELAEMALEKMNEVNPVEFEDEAKQGTNEEERPLAQRAIADVGAVQ